VMMLFEAARLTAEYPGAATSRRHRHELPQAPD
jgi:hypothetical protein